MTDFVERFDGRYLVLDEKTYAVIGYTANRAAVRLRDTDGVESEIPADDYRAYIAQGLVHASADGEEPNERIAPPSEKLERAFRRRLVEENLKLSTEGVTWAMRHEMLRDLAARDPLLSKRLRPFPTKRTIQGWTSAWLRKGPSGLRDNSHRSGNRTPRCDADFERIVHDVIESAYRSSDRLTVRGITSLAQTQYLKKCADRKTPPGPHGERIVRALVAQLPHYDVVKQRLGSPEARNRLLQAAAIQFVTAPLERVELDCTTADIQCVDDEGNRIGRPTICAAIDAATAVIVGLSVELAAPNPMLVATTIKEVMTPKDPSFFERFKIENPFQAYGRPMVVVTDQGSENSGDLLMSAIKTAAFELRKNVPGQPEKKPFIERLFRDINGYLSTLPGSTQTAQLPAKERGEKALREAKLTVADVEAALQKWRYDSYARLPRRRIQSAIRSREAPADCWKRLSRENFVPEPPTPAELRDMFMVGVAERKLQHYGVELMGFQYSSAELRALWKQTGSSIPLCIRYDPTDIREVLVIDERTGNAFRARAKDPDLPAISFEQAKRIRQSLETPKDQVLDARTIMTAIAMGYHHMPVTATSKVRRAKQIEMGRRTDKSILVKSRAPGAIADGLAQKAEAKPVPLRRPSKIPPTQPRRSK